jgi:hypothetical protein
VAVLSVYRELVSTWQGSICEGRDLARDNLPLCPGGRASFLVGLAVDEVAFEAEVVVEVGVDGGELLK